MQRKYKHTAAAAVKKIRQSSFFYRGPQLFNILPAKMRQFQPIDNLAKVHVEAFKAQLDKYLEDIPDELRSKEGGPNELIGTPDSIEGDKKKG